MESGLSKALALEKTPFVQEYEDSMPRSQIPSLIMCQRIHSGVGCTRVYAGCLTVVPVFEVVWISHVNNFLKAS